mmetsp:Transcript_110271/g.206697  ORF Transcript_110271/g.206697 Transcript_110271/m.206697 type:complete len:1466 (-) Transcript_110271:103-4500(-)
MSEYSGSEVADLNRVPAGLDIGGGNYARQDEPPSDEEENDEEAEAELMRQAEIAKKRSGARGSVSAERFVRKNDWTPPVYEKTDFQKTQLKLACSRSFMFQSLQEDDLQKVIDAFSGPQVIAPGEAVIRQGDQVWDDNPGLYILENGELSVWKLKEGVPEPGVKVFTYNTLGQTFGELALLYRSPRAATVIAEQESTVWHISRDVFNYLVKDATQEMRRKQVEFLSSVEILRDLTEDHRNKLADVLQFRSFFEGDRVIKQGDPGTEFFLLEKGSASALVNGDVVKEYGPGSYFGELALLNDAPRAASIRADSSPTVLQVLDGESFRRLLGSLDQLKERAQMYSSAPLPGAGGSGVPGAGVGADFGSNAYAPAGGGDEEEDNDDDVLDDEEFERRMSMTNKSGARAAVAAERWEPKEGFVPPVNAKSAVQYDMIKAACSKSFMFSALSNENLKMVIDAFKGPQKVKKGVEVIREGATVSSEEPSLFILEKGQLNVFKAKQGKKHPGAQVFTYDKTGQAFGEVALLYNCPRTATVIASKESLLWSIDRDTFNFCIKGAQAAMRQKVMTFLQTVELFKSLTHEELDKIADVIKMRSFDRGDQIIFEGDEGTEFFLLMQGSAYASAGGKRFTDYLPGDYFGELALLSREPRAVDIFADDSPTQVGVLSSDEFSRLLGNLNTLMKDRAKQYEEVEKCRTCGNKGKDFLGGYCTCYHGKALKCKDNGWEWCAKCSGEGTDFVGGYCSCKRGRQLAREAAGLPPEEEGPYAGEEGEGSTEVVPYLGDMAGGEAYAQDGLEADEDADEDDVMDEAENERLRIMANKRKGQRSGITAEHWEMNTDFAPPMHHKTPGQYESIRQACAKSFIFNSLPIVSFDAVIKAFKGPSIYNRGQEVIRQGDIVSSGDQGLFILEKGRLNVFKNKDGEPFPGDHVFVYDKAGQSFGEVALLYNCPRTATVIAASESVLWSIDRDTFNHCVKGAQLQFRARYSKFLASIDILRSLTPDERDRIIDVLQVRRYARGDFIIRKGDIGNEFYMVEEGGAYAQLNGARVKQYGPMHYFGELALMYRQPRAADVIADVTPTTLAMLDADSFRRLMGNLREIMVERAKEYGMSGIGDALSSNSGTAGGKGVFSMVPVRDNAEEDWFCNARRCYFRNFGRAKVCFKCGQPRPPARSAAASAFGPLSPLGAIGGPPGMMQQPLAVQSRPIGRNERTRILMHGVEVGCVSAEEGGDVYIVKYPRRLPEVGIVQGMYPLVPGERFQVTVYSLGTFGEIGVGLAPLGSEKPGSVMPGAPPPAEYKSRGSAMVGWGAQELGCMGDHGRWYVRGQVPGAPASSPWQEGDVLECGLAESGNVYVRRNNQEIAGLEGYWPAENAYPTVTFHSGGAQVLLSLANVSEKRAGQKSTQLPPADAAKEVLSNLRRTVAPSGRDRKNVATGGNRWCFWCSCRDVEVKRAEPLSAASTYGTDGNL